VVNYKGIKEGRIEKCLWSGDSDVKDSTLEMTKWKNKRLLGMALFHILFDIQITE
jgi:hypothetical protein